MSETLLRQALDVLETCEVESTYWLNKSDAVVAAIKEALAPPKTCQHCKCWEKLDPPNKGKCLNKSVIYLGDGSGFYPPPDFGCNKFEGKP